MRVTIQEILGKKMYGEKDINFGWLHPNYFANKHETFMIFIIRVTTADTFNSFTLRL